jgi:hypothetical protein
MGHTRDEEESLSSPHNVPETPVLRRFKLFMVAGSFSCTTSPARKEEEKR